MKQISRAAVPAALAKAEKYRLLNEPEQAESICHDILAVEPEHQAALTTLLLAVTDQFSAAAPGGVKAAESTLARIRDAYARSYYAGIIAERWGRALLKAGDAGRQAGAWLGEAMARYEDASSRAPADNDDAVLRWNSCARTVAKEQLGDERVADVIDAGDSAPAKR